ncbi:phospholipase B1 membrane-associated-like isoform X1 [Biomphalaria glabrata]|nr:phospholipase B1; membrane-associated-like isoform X1 [Biomphalaria glabrata]
MKTNGVSVVILSISALIVLAKDSSAKPNIFTDLPSREQVLLAKQLHLYKINSTYAALYRKTFGSLGQHAKESVGADFACPRLSPSPTLPTSVHSLRPSDVKVIAAIGDSLSAGRGADNGIIGLLVDFRGLSWSIGGDKSYNKMITLPNILREYNSALFGYSEGSGDSRARFNVAESGAKARDALGQAQRLVSLMKESSDVDFNNDWKVITLFIGGNDLCDWCQDTNEYSVEKYAAHLQETLDYLHANVPRAFINLVEVLNIEIVRDLADNLLCSAIHFFACDCAANPDNQGDLEQLIRLRESYQQAARDLAASGRYDTRDDFTVVLQPFYRETFLPRTESGDVDMSYFASDCFHHSIKGQQAAASALWNNMIEPVGSKRLTWMPGEPIECPTEAFPYFYTSKNSAKVAQPNH